MDSYVLRQLRYLSNASKIIDHRSDLLVGVVELVRGEWQARGVTHEDVDLIFVRGTQEEAATAMYEQTRGSDRKRPPAGPICAERVDSDGI